MNSIFRVVVLAFLCAPAFSHGPSHVLHEARIESIRWRRTERVHPDAILPIRIGLKQQNLGDGEELLMSVSDPESPRYGQFYTADEVTKLFSPSKETITRVGQWLESEGIHKDRITHSDNRGWFAFDGTASEAERLLHTQFYHFEHISQHKTVACDEYWIPRQLSHHIDYITPGIRLLAPKSGFHGIGRYNDQPRIEDQKKPRGKPKFLKGYPRCTHGLDCCDKLTLPECVRILYELPQLRFRLGRKPASRFFADKHFYSEQRKSKPHPNNSLGIFEWTDGDYQYDLDNFYTRYTPWIPKGTHPKLDSIDGGRAHPLKNGFYFGEANLDYTVAFPLTYPQAIVDFAADDPYITTNEIEHKKYVSLFQDFLDAIDGSYCTYKAYGEKGNDPKIDPHYPDPHKGGYKGKLECGVFKPTNVISFSYGGEEFDLPASYLKRQCNEYMKLGLQGVSLISASGDAGAAGNIPPEFAGSCSSPAKHKIFSPTYPSNCPYITSVGATMIKRGNSVTDPEVAVFGHFGAHYNYTSGGGFSNLYPAPRYQSRALSTYFSKHKPHQKSYNGLANLGKNGGVYNRQGRGFPDISANGLRLPTSYKNVYEKAGGTSAAAPMVAAIVNQIVEKRLKMGKKGLGFLNPALYHNPDVLNDITRGFNQGCKKGGSLAFTAVKGWDPVTGLGTPNYPKMEKYFLSLP